MTPAETIATALAALLEADATIPVETLLLEATAGKPRESAASGIVVNVHPAGQRLEAFALYDFSATVSLSVAIDDDKTGNLFRENYGAIWNVLDALAQEDACKNLGDDEWDVDGFQLTGGGDPPQFDLDENGGSWSCSFEATIAVRKPRKPPTP